MALVQTLYAVGALEVEGERSRVMAWLAHASRGLCEAELRRLSFARDEE